MSRRNPRFGSYFQRPSVIQSCTALLECINQQKVLVLKLIKQNGTPVHSIDIIILQRGVALILGLPFFTLTDDSGLVRIHVINKAVKVRRVAPGP